MINGISGIGTGFSCNIAPSIDILTIGKVQPEHMAYMVALPDEAFKASVKEATSIAKQLNYEVQQIEAELQADLASAK